jgi:hypothetical protein
MKPIANAKLGRTPDRPGRVAVTPVRLRECVYGRAGRNFSLWNSARQSFATRFKPLRMPASFDSVRSMRTKPFADNALTPISFPYDVCREQTGESAGATHKKCDGGPRFFAHVSVF